MTKLQAPMGMKDFYGKDLASLKELERLWLLELENNNFSEIRTPVLEEKELFIRSVGEFSDIVSKEMFSCDDLVLRPEGTAPVMRCVLENSLPLPQYLSYFSSFFRKERPQKGRFRQFYQYGCEVLGESEPQAEIKVLSLIKRFYDKLNIKYRFELNYLPSEDALRTYEEALTSFYQANLNLLSETSKTRLNNQTVLRILDSKEDRKLNETAPKVTDFLSEEDSKKWNKILSLLEKLKIPYTLNPALVRGLDYYEGLVFEVVDESNTLGAQNALGGGGRYNKLSTQLGSKEKISAFGFGGGAERLLYQLSLEEKASKTKVGLISSEDIIVELEVLRGKLESQNLMVDLNYDYTLGFKKMFKRLDKLKVNYVVVVGSTELSGNFCKVKNLTTGEEKTIPKPFSELESTDFTF